jgi:hypothetical protein
MKLNIKPGIMIAAIVTVIMAGIAVMQLREASSIALDPGKRSARYQYWDGRIANYTGVLQTLSNVMNYYECIDITERRSRFEDMMRSVFEDESDLVRIFKPGGMDANNIGRIGSGPTGQYAPAS